MQQDFESVAADPRVKFLGNVRLGADLSVDTLRSLYNGVVLAYGAASDRHLGVPGENLRGVHSARAFVNWYNGCVGWGRMMRMVTTCQPPPPLTSPPPSPQPPRLSRF